MPSVVLAGVLVSLMSAAGVPTAAHHPPRLVLASRATGIAGSKGNGLSGAAAMSGDGRYVAFFSQATNLDPADTTTGLDIYRRDLKKNITILVSRASGPHGQKGNGDSFDPSVSHDGSDIAFSSSSTNLDPSDTDSTFDVYLRNIATSRTTLVGRGSGAHGTKANGLTRWPKISDNGRFVLFTSAATNLDPNDRDPGLDVYVRDLKTNTTTLVSRASGRNGVKANADSTGSSISPDGRLVAFTSAATNLDPNDRDPGLDVYVRDLKTNTTSLVSRASGRNGVKANATSDGGTISPDRRYISFESRATNLAGNDRDTNYDIYVRDLRTDRTFLVSHASGPRGTNANGDSLSPNFGDNGRQIVFQSAATNLDRRDTDTTQDIYAHDLRTDRTYLISADGQKSNGDSRAAATATYTDDIAFQSQATNLAPDDTDTTYDVLVRQSADVR